MSDPVPSTVPPEPQADSAVAEALTIERACADRLVEQLEPLAELLYLCVRDGASVGFVAPFTPADSRAFWLDAVRPGVRAGRRLLLLAWHGHRLVGTVQLSLELPPNQHHRGDVAKLLVHPDCRRRGIARRLMQAVDAAAREAGRRLLVLDTRTGDAAEPLYLGLGYRVAGSVPDYAENPHRDGYHATTYLYKTL